MAYAQGQPAESEKRRGRNIILFREEHTPRTLTAAPTPNSGEQHAHTAPTLMVAPPRLGRSVLRWPEGNGTGLREVVGHDRIGAGEVYQVWKHRQKVRTKSDESGHAGRLRSSAASSGFNTSISIRFERDARRS